MEIRKAILKTKNMFDNYESDWKDLELWRSIAGYMDGETALVIKNEEEDSFAFLELIDKEKDKELTYMMEQDSVTGIFKDDREGFESAWKRQEYGCGECFCIPAENVVLVGAKFQCLQVS